MSRPPKVRNYYSEYHGHLVPDLSLVYQTLRSPPSPSSSSSSDQPLIWLAGDSSLDNKYWLREKAEAVGGYERVLEPSVMLKDVCYHLTKLSLTNPNLPITINTSVEATTLQQRNLGLLDQDKFIRDNLQPQDTLIISIGGNDIALSPSPCTIFNMLCLTWFTPQVCIENGFGTALPFDDFSCGCTTGILSNLLSFPFGLGYFIHLFKVRITAYINKLLNKTKPQKIVVCMIYYLDEKEGGSWADATLSTLGYNSNPGKLQSMIKKIYEQAISKIKIPGVEVVGCPLFEVLDGKDTRDYVARVEPSERGGEKMARLLSLCVTGDIGGGGVDRN
ncbi:hypothetical protein TrLO_g15038 [Triparma laevis f. longispina]|uniref:Uncharacterized protein n=1 Tax=Triparma laevis f. longispina TaxID=1714387 RepID=A0A9W6ZVM3_9STRA|nr:hypothetical protein TrLO_g15038 [Triparma laevis f. longispina]